MILPATPFLVSTVQLPGQERTDRTIGQLLGWRRLKVGIDVLSMDERPQAQCIEIGPSASGYGSCRGSVERHPDDGPLTYPTISPGDWIRSDETHPPEPKVRLEEAAEERVYIHLGAIADGSGREVIIDSPDNSYRSVAGVTGCGR